MHLAPTRQSCSDPSGSNDRMIHMVSQPDRLRQSATRPDRRHERRLRPIEKRIPRDGRQIVDVTEAFIESGQLSSVEG